MATTNGQEIAGWNLPKITSKGPLLPEIREALESYASNQTYKFEKDSVGNIYITKSGRDSDLSGIAITFPIDTREQNARFHSALDIFDSLKETQTSSDIILLGWSSPQEGRQLGRDVWEEELSLKDAYSTAPELKQFEGQGLSDPAELSLSAIIEVTGGNENLAVEGSFVLIDKVKKLSEGEAQEKKQHDGTPTSNKAPIVRISGRRSEEIGRKLVVEYSRYVAGLFENFD